MSKTVFENNEQHTISIQERKMGRKGG